VLEKIQKSQRFMQLLNTLQAPTQFLLILSVTPLPLSEYTNLSVKGNQMRLRSLAPFR
jgi:hypothetical protein